jgi:hypothetical protein
MSDLSKIEPNLVKVTRRRKGPGDLNPVEHFVGYLVDFEGNNVNTPEVGQPIYLSGEDKQDEPWLFATDPVYRLEVYATHWSVTTEKGDRYDIENDRVIQ